MKCCLECAFVRLAGTIYIYGYIYSVYIRKQGSHQICNAGQPYIISDVD